MILSASFCCTLFTKSKMQKKAISCPWASRNMPNGQLRCPLHIYMMRRIQWTWFGVILSSSFCCMPFTKSKMPKKTAISCPWASWNLPDGQLRCPLHIYMLSRIQRTGFGVILSVSFCCTLFTKSETPKNSNFVPVGKSKFAQWAIKVSIAHLRIETNTMNLIWSDSDR